MSERREKDGVGVEENEEDKIKEKRGKEKTTQKKEE